MKFKFITILLLFITIEVCGQKLTLKKASPFVAVKWENEQPIVRFNKQWFKFEKLEHITSKELVDYCKNNYPEKWKKRFSEDLVEVLKGMNYTPNTNVKVQLSKDGISKEYQGTFTSKNRQLSLYFNRKFNQQENTVKNKKKTVTKEEAIEDLYEFEKILETRSSYIQISDFKYKEAIKSLRSVIDKEDKDVNIDKLANTMAMIMAEVGDRHSSVRNKYFKYKSHPTFNLKLPFGLTNLNGKLIALKRDTIKEHYNYLSRKYPYIKSINGIDVNTLIDSYNYKNKYAPFAAKQTRAAEQIEEYGAMLFYKNISTDKEIDVILTNKRGKKETHKTFELTTQKERYFSKTRINNYKIRYNILNKKFDLSTKIIDHNIGYINIPKMFDYSDIKGYKKFLNTKIQEYSSTNALIIDIRNNSGGTRDILQTIASYIVKPSQSPWVANVAFLRTEKATNSEIRSMNGRYLFSFNSKHLSENDRKAITEFNKTFKIESDFDKSKFSEPYYMVLHNGKMTYTKPVYILVNERCFSAATVFTTSFKGLPNIKIVGVTTDGSSGNSKKIYLKNSNIRVKVSTMLSIQRNGKTLDGNGTEPDIYIPVEEKQILTGEDIQLKKLVARINKKNNR
ncbi:MAG: S41 family peptidase [Prolixibacteraceae bacterium]|jgi:C-terminal processing protease CtpA/Prc|nr:S41 family peptidase [Prolixibacteraceae bacterium]